MSVGNVARIRLTLAIIGCAIWLAAMIWMTIYQANPVAISRLQVLSAAAVVKATLEIRDDDVRLKVGEILWSKRPMALDEFPAEGIVSHPKVQPWHQNGIEVFAALEESSPGRFRIQPIPFAGEVPAGVDQAPLYPVTDRVRRGLEELRPKDRTK